MRAKMIASILALMMLSAVMCMAADDDDEKKRQKTRKMALRPCRICTSWNPLPKQLSRKQRDTPFSTTWG